VVVGKGDGAHPDRAQRLDGDRGSTKEERLARDSPGGLAPLGDAALEIADNLVERRAELAQLLAPELRGRGIAQGLGHAAAEHHVAE
jgi:hypothetical protein